MVLCSDCKRPILWLKEGGKNIAYDAIQRAGEPRSAGTVHWKNCPVRQRKWETTHCPACQISLRGNIDYLDEIDTTKPFCRIHAQSMRMMVGARQYDLNEDNLHKLRRKIIRAKKTIAKKRKELEDEGLLNALNGFIGDDLK